MTKTPKFPMGPQAGVPPVHRGARRLPLGLGPGRSTASGPARQPRKPLIHLIFLRSTLGLPLLGRGRGEALEG